MDSLWKTSLFSGHNGCFNTHSGAFARRPVVNQYRIVNSSPALGFKQPTVGVNSSLKSAVSTIAGDQVRVAPLESVAVSFRTESVHDFVDKGDSGALITSKHDPASTQAIRDKPPVEL